MSKWILITFILLASLCQAQKYHGFYTDFGYETNLSKHAFNLDMNYQFSPIIGFRPKLVAIGVGTEYFFDKELIMDTKIIYPLKQVAMFHLYWMNEFPSWYIATHYKFSIQLDKQFICPELGYNFPIDYSRLFLLPIINHFIDLKSNKNGLKNFFAAFKIKYVMFRGMKKRIIE